MTTGRTLAAAAAGLAVVLTAGFGVGRLVPPIVTAPAAVPSVSPSMSTAPHDASDSADTSTHSG